MLTIGLRVKKCLACGKQFNCGEDSVSTGHLRATNCHNEYVSVAASWHRDCFDSAKAHEMMSRQDAEPGCIGKLEEWMGVETGDVYDCDWLDIKKRRGLAEG